MACTLCAHPDRRAIDELLVGAGASARSIEKQFGVGRNVVLRHSKQCLKYATDPRTKGAARRRVARRIAAAGRDAPRPQIDSVDDFRTEILRLYHMALAQLEGAQASGDARLAQKALGDALATLQELGRTIGAFVPENAITVNVDARKVVFDPAIPTEVIAANLAAIREQRPLPNGIPKLVLIDGDKVIEAANG